MKNKTKTLMAGVAQQLTGYCFDDQFEVIRNPLTPRLWGLNSKKKKCPWDLRGPQGEGEGPETVKVHQASTLRPKGVHRRRI